MLETPQPFAEYGLDEASARVVRFGTGEGTRELWLGKETPVGANTYARVDRSDSVHTVVSFHTKAFDRTLSDLRDKQILQLDNASGVREIEARWPGGRVVVERVDAADGQAAQEALAEPEWRLTAPFTARADADAIYDLLTTLSLLRAEGIVDAPSETTRRLLDPPDFEVTLRTAIRTPSRSRRFRSAGPTPPTGARCALAARSCSRSWPIGSPTSRAR